MATQRRFSSSTQVVPGVVASAAYAIGDSIGTLITFPNVPKQGIINTINVVDEAKQSIVSSLMFFPNNAPATTITDNGALDVDDTDLKTCIGVVTIPAANYQALADNSFATVKDINLAYAGLPGGQNGEYKMFAMYIAGGTPTFAAATDVQITLVIEELS